MAFTYPTVTDFKNYFTRDFPYAPSGQETNQDYVLDTDISKAQGEAKFNINMSFFGTQENFNIGFNYLTAHYLVTDLQNSSQGIAGKYTWLEASKSAGSVSQSFAIPERITKNPLYALIAATRYGAKYLSLILPNMVGRIFSTPGRTHA